MVDIEEILKYYRMGLQIIPLKKGEKKPAINSWLDLQSKRVEETRIREWFSSSSSDLNFGVVTGEVSGNLVVFDFDDLDSLAFAFKDLQAMLKKTIVVKTGKGMHIYFRAKNSCPPSGKLTNLHVDIQSNGKYVVGAGSIHPSGAVYTSIGADSIAVVDDVEGLIDTLHSKDAVINAARFLLTIWKSGNRHEVALRFASLVKKQLSWDIADTKDFISGVMRMAEDQDEVLDRMRAIDDAYDRSYPYITSDFSKEFVDEILRLLPRSDNTIWATNLKEDGSDQFLANPDGTFRSRKVKDGNMLEKVFDAPLILTDAFTREDRETNEIFFQVTLGKNHYSGTKTDILMAITESAPSALKSGYFSDALNACIVSYTGRDRVPIRQAFAAPGIYEKSNKFVLAVPGSEGIDIDVARGTEPWFVLREFKKAPENMIEPLKIFNRLWEFTPDSDSLAVLFGMSLVYPFSYAMKADGDLFFPSIILEGPKGTGKSTLGSLFTEFLYGVKAGGPSDISSEFRFLDFVTGTTFPRLVDESENVKFEGTRFSPKISAGMKDASQRQLVGTRGYIEGKHVKKALYNARTPLIIAGNEIEIQDPALLARVILLPLEKLPETSRSLFRDEVLAPLKDYKGFGVNIMKKIVNNIEFNDFITKIRNVDFTYNFKDARREDMYAEIYIGLEMWKEVYNSYGLDFSLESYLEPSKFLAFIGRVEEKNSEAEKERQLVVSLIEWSRMMIDSLTSPELDSDNMRASFQIIQMRNKMQLVEERGMRWIALSQPGIETYLSEHRNIKWSNLSAIAEELAKYYSVSPAIFYDHKARRIGQSVKKVVLIPYEGLGINNYGAGGDPPVTPEDTAPDGVLKQSVTGGYRLVTGSVTRLEPAKSMLPDKVVTDQEKNTDFPIGKIPNPNGSFPPDFPGYMVTRENKTTQKTNNINGLESTEKCNQNVTNVTSEKIQESKTVENKGSQENKEPVTKYETVYVAYRVMKNCTLQGHVYSPSQEIIIPESVDLSGYLADGTLKISKMGGTK